MDKVELERLSENPDSVKPEALRTGKGPKGTLLLPRRATETRARDPTERLFRQSLETVWKLRTGSISWSHEAAQRGEIAHLSALRVTDKRAIRPVQLLSRQSLEGVLQRGISALLTSVGVGC